MTAAEPGFPGTAPGSGQPTRGKVRDMPENHEIGARLGQAVILPEILAAGFDAFEAIRMAARDHQDRVPTLFAAFMTTANAAVDGREALTIAPSLPPAGQARPGQVLPEETGAGEAADALAVLAAALGERLRQAAVLAEVPGDQAACQQGAAAARRICELMTRGEHDARLR